MSTAMMLSTLVPFCSGTTTVHPVKLFQVNGHSIPFTQIVLTLKGAVPLTYARLLLRPTAELTEKLAALTAAIWLAMLVRACESHVLIAELGFSTLKPFATKVLYLASSNGPVLVMSSGPLTNSCR